MEDLIRLKKENNRFSPNDKLKIQSLVMGGYVPKLFPDYFDINIHQMYGALLSDFRVKAGQRKRIRHRFGTFPDSRLIPVLWRLHSPAVIRYILLESRLRKPESNLYHQLLDFLNSSDEESLSELVSQLNSDPDSLIEDMPEKHMIIETRPVKITVRDNLILNSDGLLDKDRFESTAASILNDTMSLTRTLLDKLLSSSNDDFKSMTMSQKINSITKLIEKMKDMSTGMRLYETNETTAGGDDVIDALEEIIPVRNKDVSSYGDKDKS